MRFFVSGLLMCLPVGVGARMGLREFDRAREEIQVLTLERLRVAPDDAQVLVTGENRLRALYETYQVEGSTPAVALETDTAALRREGKIRVRLRAAGRFSPADPRAQEMIARRWEAYRVERDALRATVASSRREGAAESVLYWSSLRAFDRLAREVRDSLVHNTPPGEKNLESALARDREELLLSLELTPKQTRGPKKVVVPTDHAPSLTMDVSSFFRAVDQLPDRRPVISGAWIVPVGARTVTERRAGLRLVVRPTAGEGVAHVGTQEVDLRYGYLVIPAETAYYFENTGDRPLDIDYVGILP